MCVLVKDILNTWAWFPSWLSLGSAAVSQKSSFWPRLRNFVTVGISTTFQMLASLPLLSIQLVESLYSCCTTVLTIFLISNLYMYHFKKFAIIDSDTRFWTLKFYCFARKSKHSLPMASPSFLWKLKFSVNWYAFFQLKYAFRTFQMKNSAGYFFILDMLAN